MIRILLGMPNNRSISMETVACLIRSCGTKKVRINGQEEVLEISFLPAISSCIHAGRNALLIAAIEGAYQYLLFVDDDMVWTTNNIIRIVERMLAKDAAIITGLYYSRDGTNKPIAYERIESANNTPDGKARTTSISNDGFYPIAGCGLGFALVNTKIARELYGEFANPFEPEMLLGEDLIFCYRISQKNKIYIDTSIRLGHIGNKVYCE